LAVQTAQIVCVSSDELSRLNQIVWEFRAEQKKFPTPDSKDSILFALTEAAEAIDAELRNNPRYLRSHTKNLNKIQELLQCLIMILTALGPDHRFPAQIYMNGVKLTDVYSIVCQVALMFAVYVTDGLTWRTYAERAAAAIVDYLHRLGMSPTKAVQTELTNWAAKLTDASQ
jgi:hypothetical protein